MARIRKCPAHNNYMRSSCVQIFFFEKMLLKNRQGTREKFRLFQLCQRWRCFPVHNGEGVLCGERSRKETCINVFMDLFSN